MYCNSNVQQNGNINSRVNQEKMLPLWEIGEKDREGQDGKSKGEENISEYILKIHNNCK